MLKLSQKSKDIYWLYRQVGGRDLIPLTYTSKEAQTIRRLLDQELLHNSPLVPTHEGKTWLKKVEELTKKYKAAVYFDPEYHMRKAPKWKKHPKKWFICQESKHTCFLHNAGFSIRTEKHFASKITDKVGNFEWDVAMIEAYKTEKPVAPMKKLLPTLYQTSSPDEPGIIWLMSKDWKVKLPIDERFYYLILMLHPDGKFFGRKGYYNGNRIIYRVNKKTEAFVAPMKKDAIQIPDFKSFKR